MANSKGAVPLKEVNNYSQGKSGSKVKEIRGPVGSVSGNPTKSGGIYRPTKSN